MERLVCFNRVTNATIYFQKEVGTRCKRAPVGAPLNQFLVLKPLCQPKRRLARVRMWATIGSNASTPLGIGF